MEEKTNNKFKWVLISSSGSNNNSNNKSNKDKTKVTYKEDNNSKAMEEDYL